MKKNVISISGAREHNLKDISLEIPKNLLTVITGVSGSGKSSLAFDTLYAEGQRRYVESLSSYARQFLGQMEKPDVDHIEGLSPAISIEQKSASRNPRSTVGTVTEIYDYLRVVYARIGIRHCPECGRETGAQTAEQIVDQISGFPSGARMLLLAPVIKSRKGIHAELLDDIKASGFSRIRVNGRLAELSEPLDLDKNRKHNVEVVVDRLRIKPGIKSRLNESVELALKVGGGMMIAALADGNDNASSGYRDIKFSENFACVDCGISFEEMTPQLFSFNSPQGACSRCNGLGSLLVASPELIMPDPDKPVRYGIAALGALTSNSYTLRKLGRFLKKIGASLTTHISELDEYQKNAILWGGVRGSRWEGVARRVARLYLETSSEGARNWYARFMENCPCPECKGSRLRPEARCVRIGGRTITELCTMSIGELSAFFEQLELPGHQAEIGAEIIKELRLRLRFLLNIGLHYLSLNRAAPGLSGGESQRIRLASQIGSGLVGVLYVLDEPSIGLHQRDNNKLISMLKYLKDIGNTVIVVEHDRDTMLAADRILDLGPGAGELGGSVVAFGTPAQIRKAKTSLTGKYLNGDLVVHTPGCRRTNNGFLELNGASLHNLKDVNLKIPTGCFTCVTGVSGSGKSSLIAQTLYPAMANLLNRATKKPGSFRELKGTEIFEKVVDVDQQPIGRTPRSNPATYVKVFDHIRKLFAQVPESRMRGYQPGRFSFNVKGGRCEECEGAGFKKIEMHFLPDVHILCEACRGSRFNRETLQVRYRGYNIAQILDMSVRKAMNVFSEIPTIIRILSTLHDVGLDYVKLGQPSTTLSGGEAQRIKLARELCRREHGGTLYILDEPTTGLHPADVQMLLKVLNRLVDEGNTIVVIEHNMDVIKSADYIVDLGPEGGDHGGEIIAAGTPEQVALIRKSWTGRYLRKELADA